MTETNEVKDNVEPKVVTPKKKKYPIIDEKTCAGCSVCVENCPVNCLAIEPPKYHGDITTIAKLIKPEICLGCGICAKACPIRAITIVEA